MTEKAASPKYRALPLQEFHQVERAAAQVPERERAPAVAVPEPEPVQQTAEERVMSMDAGYAVQIFASTNMASMDKYKAQNGLDDMLAVRTDRDGSVLYVLVSTHPDRASANRPRH